jgi:Thioredoxin like C-terminal domain
VFVENLNVATGEIQRVVSDRRASCRGDDRSVVGPCGGPTPVAAAVPESEVDHMDHQRGDRANRMVNDQRTYQPIRQAGPIGDRLFEVGFQEAGIEAYCLTFG